MDSSWLATKYDQSYFKDKTTHFPLKYSLAVTNSNLKVKSSFQTAVMKVH